MKSPACIQWIPVRYVFTLLAFVGFVFNYTLRININLVITSMVNHTALNDTDHYKLGSEKKPDGPFVWDSIVCNDVTGLFFAGYMVFQLPGGRLAETLGGKRVMTVAMGGVALLSLLIPSAAKLGGHTGYPYYLVIVRIMMGLFEAATFPCITSMLARWAPQSERSTMSTLIMAGSQAGTIVGFFVSGLLADRWGWESVFYLFGSLGVFWYVFWWWLVYDSPSTHPFIHPAEKRHILDSLGTLHNSGPLPVPWRHILTSGPVWALVVTHVAQNYGFYTILTELPTYMANVLHFNIKSNAMISALPYLLMFLVSIVSTQAADWALARGMERTRVRKVFNSLAIYLPAVFIVLAGYSGCDYILTIVLLCLAVGCNGCHYAGFMCVHIDIASNYAGTLLGITNCAANFMGFVAPNIAGNIVEGHSDVPHWRLVFFIAALVYCLGNTVFLVFGTSKEQRWNRIWSEIRHSEQSDDEEDPVSNNDY